MSSSRPRIPWAGVWLALLAGSAPAVTLGSNAITSANGIHVDPDQDGVYEVFIGGNGSLEAGSQAGNVQLGITGNARILSSLDLSGNAVLSGNVDLCAGNVLVDAANAMLRIGSAAPRSALQLSGSLGFLVQQATGNTTLGDNSFILAKPDQAGGNIVLTLPAAASVPGRTYCVKKSSNSSNTVTISGTVDGSSDVVLGKDTIGYPYAEVASDGAAWHLAYRSDSTNSPPRLSAITAKGTPRNVPLRFVTFTADEGWRSEESPQALSVHSCTSSNQVLVSNGNFGHTFTDEGRGGHGELTISPSTNQTGDTDITLTVTDGLDTVSGNFLVTVTPAVSPPTAWPVHACTNINTGVNITLFAVDSTSGHAITGWTNVTSPRHGTLAGSANFYTYTPDTGFTGRDWFTWHATDSAGESSSIGIATFLVAGNAAFIVANATSLAVGERNAKTMLSSMGITVTATSDNSANGTEGNGRDILILSGSCAEAQIKAIYKDMTTPILTWMPSTYGLTQGLAMCPDDGSTAVSSNTLAIVASHPLAGGLASGNQWVYDPAASMARAVNKPYSSATVVGNVLNATGDPGLFVYASGANINGFLAPAKRVATFLDDGTSDGLTPTGNILFQAAVNEALAR